MAGNRQRGLVALAGAALEAQGHVSGGVQVPSGSGIDSALNVVAGELGQTGDRIGKMADEAAQREGTEAGQAAGFNNEFRTIGEHTIRGDAYDRAVLQVAETKFKGELDLAFDAAYEKNAGNVAGVQAALAEASKNVLKNAPKEIAGELQALASRKGLQLVRQATREHFQQVRADQAAALQEDLAGSMRGIHQRAFGLGLDAEADKAIAGDFAALARTLTRPGIDGKPLVNPPQAAKMLAAAKREVNMARLSGAFERLETVADKQKFIASFEDDFKNAKGIAKDFDYSEFTSMRTSLSSSLNRAISVQNQTRHVIEGQLKKFVGAAEDGFAPRPEDLAAIKSAAAADPAIAAAVESAESLMKWQSVARQQTPETLGEVERQLRDRMAKDGPDDYGLAQLKFVEKLAANAERGLKTDGLGWADKTGVVSVPPLDIDNPESWALRFAARDEASRRYGRDLPALRPDDKRMLIERAGKGDMATLEVIAKVTAGAGERAGKVFSELFQDAPTVAQLGTHVTALGVTALAKDAAKGIALSRLDAFKPVLSTNPSAAANARRLAHTVHGGALDGMPELSASLNRLTNYAFEARAAQLGLADARGPQADDLWIKTYREVLGERSVEGRAYGGVTAHGSRTVLVPHDIRQDLFSDVIDALKLEDFGDDPPRFKAHAASERDLRHAELVSAGDGLYKLNVGSEEVPLYLANKAGKPFVIDLNQLKPVLRQRLPLAYIDGVGAP